MSNFPNIHLLVSTLCKEKGTNISQLSKQLGYSASNFTTQLKNKYLKTNLLIDISNALEVNLFEAYTSQLNETARSTSAERQLRHQLAETKGELEKVTAERDKYWDAIVGKMAST